jgi:hypothetical protein
MTPPGDGRLFDRQGCLTPAGLAVFQGAAPGRAPAEVAAHVAACVRCQQRLLSGMRGPGQPASVREARGSPNPWRRLIVAVGGLLFLLIVSLAALVAVRSLAAR